MCQIMSSVVTFRLWYDTYLYDSCSIPYFWPLLGCRAVHQDGQEEQYCLAILQIPM